MSDIHVAERYGRTAGSRRRRVTLAVVTGVAVLIAAVVWVLWAGLFSPTASLESRDLGYRNLPDQTVEVRFEVTTEPGTAVSCALQALNEDFGVVGWKVVELAPSDTRTRQFTQVVRTAEPALTGLIYRCWLT
ncbi:MAG: DUF4307 domain-containing protein [Pseudolysinimonas sp.]|uniref:DUF4307 domain-containing protein n=1 Tax=Pseudolysinimonas sp. TaxID=2680009 RepID=UPI003263A2F4